MLSSGGDNKMVSECTKKAINRYRSKGKMVLISNNLKDQLNRWNELGYPSRLNFCDELAKEISKQ